ncbi:MAG TPA: ABC transporter permease [Candidatus Deferrimicrobium sp.]|nr:ABC transporter permease [Candidatus Deferrimicrobium sp.]
MKGLDISFSISKALAKREFLKYLRNKSRFITSLFQSLIFLFIFGAGLGSISLISAGMIPQAILFTGIFSGISIVQDRMFGFLKEIMIAPVSRTTITFGKAMGGTLVAAIQGFLLLALTSAFGFFGYDSMLFLRIVSAIPLIFLIGFMTVSLGNLISTRMQDFHQMQYLMTFLVMPMFFTSGAIINFVGTPFFKFTLINPMTYAVDAMRHIMLSGTPSASFGLPLYIDIIVLACFSFVFIIIAAYIFRKSESV